MPKELLYIVDVSSLLQKVSGKAMPQNVNAYGFGYASIIFCIWKYLLYRSSEIRQMCIAGLEEELPPMNASTYLI